MMKKTFALVIFALMARGQETQPSGEKLAPYYPTPETIVDRMLDAGQLKAGEKMFDLGSGAWPVGGRPPARQPAVMPVTGLTSGAAAADPWKAASP